MSNKENSDNKVILQKYIAQSGYCSRRQAENLVRDKKVRVNGQIAELGDMAGEEDKVEVEGKKMGKPPDKIYFILNKPAGYTCTTRKFKNEKNVFDLINIKERLFIVGRLDKYSRGLVLLTNDGDLAQSFAHPKFGHEKEYIVKVESRKSKACPEPSRGVKSQIHKIQKIFELGVDIGEGDGVVKAKNVEYIGNSKFKIILTEGKKRQIRRMFNVMGYEVTDLQRVRIGNIELGDLKEGEWMDLDISKLVN